MKDINQVRLMGRVGMDPVLHKFNNGTHVMKLRMATGERWKGQDGEWRERTQWHAVNLYSEWHIREMADLQKGDMLYVEGMLEYRTYDKDGVTHNATDIRVTPWSSVHRVTVPARPKEDNPTPNHMRSGAGGPRPIDEMVTELANQSRKELDDDIPF